MCEKEKIRFASAFRLLKVKQALEQNYKIDEIYEQTQIDPWFLYQIKKIVDLKKQISIKNLLPLKQNGFSDLQIAKELHKTEDEIRLQRKKNSILPSYKVVDTCAAEFVAKTPYCYSSYDTENEIEPLEGKKVIILGGGPNRIGQGIEFDYCCVQAVFGLQDQGYKTIMINCNP